MLLFSVIVLAVSLHAQNKLNIKAFHYREPEACGHLTMSSTVVDTENNGQTSIATMLNNMATPQKEWNMYGHCHSYQSYIV